MSEPNAKADLTAMIRKHGANGTILALSAALKDLGPEWQGDDGPAVGVESVTGYSPHQSNDWKGVAPTTYRLTYNRDNGTVLEVETIAQHDMRTALLVSDAGLRARAKDGAVSCTVEPTS